jgi:hypothetical protein
MYEQLFDLRFLNTWRNHWIETAGSKKGPIPSFKETCPLPTSICVGTSPYGRATSGSINQNE